MAVRIFGKTGEISDGLRCLQYCGLFGGFWLGFFALGQKSSKRLFSGLMGGTWSVLLASGSMRSPMASSAIVYGACSILFWGTLLSFVWSRLQESSGDESIAAIYGSGRTHRGYGLLLIAALAGPLMLPAFPGFVSVILQLASVIEQRSFLLLVAFSLLLILFSVISARLAADLLFRPAVGIAREARVDFLRYDRWDLFPLALLLIGMLWLGVLGNKVFTGLYEAAKPFLN
jgi:NADH:ubiquinone oxidoreductase subunit 2 (subunit N)